ncbi:MAG: alpha-2-macroglobulin family protein [Phenylobacterium sp.]|uniref:alpha-2-macroglobulin family protein n=1 Tax=Phenylobacterium sp. TaxID=1871053 RepID=UPI0025F46597|nr:alpha-2-macroglobulin [Phenylobacterium sp.]MCG9916459.1 alpha-2-macroglobulin family protein [Phenylobacterium sp.]
MTSNDDTHDPAAPEPTSPQSEPPEAAPAKAPWWRGLRSRLTQGRTPVVLAGVLIVAAFGGGFLTAKGVDVLRIPRLAVSGADTAPEGWSLFGRPRGADAPRRGAPAPEGFAVWRTRVDTSTAQPRACIEMSRPLDPQVAYADYVLVSPDLGETPAIAVDGAELCVAGLGFTERRVTLLKGLPGRGGETLQANADIDFTFGEKPPFVGFAGDGVILPREESDGVGIETVNVTRLGIEVWRVADRNLVRTSISAPEPTAEGEWAYDWGSDSPDQEGQKVWSGEIDVTSEAGRRATTVFPLGAVLREMKPGGYVIKARDASGGRTLTAGDDSNPPAQARRWIIFTDMALSAYTGTEATDVVVRSLKSARPQSGIRVALVAANGEDLAEARTDGQGRARFAAALTQGEGALRAKMIMAYGPQGDLALLDLDRPPADLSRLGVGGRITETAPSTAGRTAAAVVDAYVYTDRGVYRPGETVHLNALLRDQEARAVKGRKGAIVVRRPSGVEFKRLAFDGAPLGSVAADIALPRSAPRGRWRVSLEIEGLERPAGEITFAVEDFAPQRLAVTLTGQEASPVAAGQSRNLDINARFLYGAPGSGLQAEGEARLRVDNDPFPAFEGYQWGDQRTPFQEAFVDLGRTVTDGEGRAIITLPPQAADSAQPLVAATTVSVFEPGGRPVRESLDLKIRPRATYLGVKVSQADGARGGDPTVSLDLIAVDRAGRRVAAPGVTWRLVSENWDYDWFQQDGRWQWRRTSRDALVAQGEINLAAADPARLSRRLGWGDYRIELTGPDGAASVIRFTSGWGAPAEDAEAPDIVRVSAGDKAYAQGDTVEITLKPPYAGEVQVAVATDRVLDFRTLTVGENGATVRFQSDASWGGGAYVMVTVVQPRDPVRTPKPRRALGLVYVPLDPKGRKLEVDLGTPEKAGAREALSVPITVKGAGLGQRVRVTLAAVDEGILRLTRYDSPDPAKWYFGKRALGVDYRDDYGRLLDPNLGAPANVNFGGDEIGGEGLTVTPIKTVALWSGVVETGRDGKATIQLPAPDFNGELRLMAVAWTDDAVGSASKPLLVREPVVAELALPRFLAPGDKAFATLELHNIEGRAGEYIAQLTGEGGLLAPFRKAYELVVGQRLAERVPLDAPRTAGIGKVSLTVTGPGFTSTRDYPLQTRLGWSRVTRTTVALQQPGSAYTPAPDLLAGLAAGDATLQVSYSPFRGFDPGPIAVSLLRYPYGCTEQLVSAAYPLLYAANVSQDPKARRSSLALNQAVSRLLDRQTLDGAFGMWRVGDGEADAWLGAYATDFLVEAQKAGAPVPAAALERALGAMRHISRPEGWANISYRLEYPSWWAGSPEASETATATMRRRASAYALYVLAKGGRGDLGRLRWWHDVQMKTEASPLAKAHVGAGLALMGDKARARSAFRQAVRSLNYREESDWYQSPLRDLAAVIALAYEAGETDIARELQGRLENAVEDPEALNTQEQARLLQAANAMMAAAGPLKIEGAGAIPLAAVAGGPRWAVGKLAESRFVNAGAGAVWRTVTVSGAPVAAPAAASNGLTLQKRLLSFTGGPVDPASLTQGDRVIVVVSGRAQQARSMALVIDDPLPAGFEIETVLGPDDAQSGPFRFLGQLSSADVQEARDDRYVAAMDLPGREDFAFAYVARAVTPGDFLLPGAEARDMYRPAVNARTSVGRTVVAPGQ